MPASPARAGPSRQPQEDGFGLVVSRVRHRHAVRLRRTQYVGVKTLPRIASGHFERHTVARRDRGNIRIADKGRDLEALGQALGKRPRPPPRRRRERGD